MTTQQDVRRTVWTWFGVIGTVTIALDQITKVWARNSLPPNGAPVSVIDNYWDWQLAYNTGSAFSML